MDLPPYVLRNMSGYYSSFDSRLRQVNHQLSELIPEPTLDEQVDELLDLFKADCKYIMDWMKSLSKIDLILNMNNMRVRKYENVKLYPEYIRVIRILLTRDEPITSDKEYINSLQDLISVISQLKTWRDFKNMDVKFSQNAKQLFYEKYLPMIKSPEFDRLWRTTTARRFV
jgi:hypothetical protein